MALSYPPMGDNPMGGPLAEILAMLRSGQISADKLVELLTMLASSMPGVSEQAPQPEQPTISSLLNY